MPPTDAASGAVPDTGGSGLISVAGSNGGIDADVVDTDSDGHGLVDVHSDASAGLLGDTLDGTHIDVITPDSLADAHVPGMLDATLGDGTVGGRIGDVIDGDGAGPLTDLGNLGNLTDGLQGLEIDALHDGNILDVHAPDLADITVGDGELGGILDTVDGNAGTDGITAKLLNGDNIAELHAGDIADVTVGGGSEVGGLLGTLGEAIGDAAGSAADAHGLSVEVLNGEYVAEAHAPGVLDATVGGAELGNLVGGTDVGSLLGGVDLPSGGGDILGDALHVGSGGDLAGLELGHTLDSVTG